MSASPADGCAPPLAPREELASRLLRARDAARIVAFRKVPTPLWTPVRGECHRNVDRLVAQDESYAPVRGWLIFDLARGSAGLFYVSRFLAHSVVERDGELIDITPSRGAGRYPFIVHPGSVDEFKWLIEREGVASIDCRHPAEGHEG